jgi:hypothetical protein
MKHPLYDFVRNVSNMATSARFGSIYDVLDDLRDHHRLFYNLTVVEEVDEGIPNVITSLVEPTHDLDTIP